ncbi:glycosyltransferase [Bizionia myxarmorum]|uniref:Glycosyltransferase n=1 Tax=Bizionia myxarmorum TaxID=291186 RepID=A0A5D0R644_9FLAO|nr:glycosyltransferase [Bizionia myxarmorum]TYB77012.1 glycosyltransferase [Bizionia myxarmorum]
MRSLTIISHTEHYQQPDGQIVGLGSTVTEINHLLAIFDTITHVAMLHDGSAPPSALPYSSEKISFIALTALGGTTWRSKIRLIFQAPKIIGIVRRALRGSDYFQFRAPTGIGVFVIPYFILCRSKKGWFKYAGNWKQEHGPLAYRFEKWLLAHQSRAVTINGFWEDQPDQCLSFENPCLTELEIVAGQDWIQSRTLKYPIDICFVGRLEAAKGLDLLLEALAELDADQLHKINQIHIVGDGTRMDWYQKQAFDLNLPVVFHGYLSRDAVHGVYKKCAILVLPSASEGFPKVVAEALNFGCIPIVSNVSSMSHYIKNGVNGYLMDGLDVASLTVSLQVVLNLKSADYEKLKSTTLESIQRFSYSYYNQRLEQTIL